MIQSTLSTSPLSYTLCFCIADRIPWRWQLQISSECTNSMTNCLASLISSRCALSSALLNAVPSALPALSEARATTISLAGQTLTWSRADLACDGFAEFPQFLKAGPAPVSSLPWLQLSTAGAHPRFLYSRPQPQMQMFAGVHLDGEWGSLVQGYVMATASWAAGQLPAAVGSVGRHRAPATCVPSYSEAQW